MNHIQNLYNIEIRNNNVSNNTAYVKQKSHVFKKIDCKWLKFKLIFNTINYHKTICYNDYLHN